MTEPKFTMNIGLNVLNHLGINLYSNIPAVISEVVANAWDADSQNVFITIAANKIVITDNGCGMSANDVNNKYLFVGYERRKHKGEEETPLFHRPVMGRKGIGKLSLFSIADTIEIQTMKGAEKSGFVMSAIKLKELLNVKKDSQPYHPDPIDEAKITIAKQGTIVTLTDLKKSTSVTEVALRKRLARRFGVIGDRYKFNVLTNGRPITLEDREYYNKLQYLWYYGEVGQECKDQCKHLEFHENRDNAITYKSLSGIEEKVDVSGWIATVAKSGQLQDGEDNLNKIVVLVRGKLAQEDILEDFPEGGLYSKYLIGEIRADFLDTDEGEDSATTNRQEIKKDDLRYIALKGFIQGELKHIQSKWTELRNATGTQVALLIPAISAWFVTLDRDQRKHAETLFGKINQLTVEDDEEKKQLFKYGVLAFESYRYKQNLNALDNINVEDLKTLSKIFADHDDIESTLYHQITKARLKVIEILKNHVEEPALEKVIQKHLFEHLWLLDPAWERSTETPLMEQKMETAFGEVYAGLTAEEKECRFDIRYKKTAGKHVIIELKKADRVLKYTEIMAQLDKYKEALSKILTSIGEGGAQIECICLVGKQLKEYTSPGRIKEIEQSMSAQNYRVVMYQKLIEDSYRSYRDYLDTRKDTNRVSKLIEDIEKSEF